MAAAAGGLLRRLGRGRVAARAGRGAGSRLARSVRDWFRRRFRRGSKARFSRARARRRFPGSLFGSGGEAPVHPRIRPTTVPERPPRPPLPPPVPPFAAALDPRLKAMRRAAAVDMFDQVGLDIVPGQLWRFVDSGGDVFQAVVDFLGRLGLDVDAVRSGDRAERARANDVLDLLVQAESAFARLRPAAVDRIEEAIFSGEYDRVRDAVEIVAVYENVVRLGDRWPKDARFAAFESFLGDVAAALDDPLSSTLDDAREAANYADQLSDLMGRLDKARRGHVFWLDELRTIGRAAWERWDELAEVERGIVTFANLAQRIADTFFTVDDLAGLVAELERINAFLETVISAHVKRGRRDGGAHRASSGGDGGASAAGGASFLEEWEKALIRFGFARTDRPSARDVRKRYLELIKKTHPDSSAGTGDTAAAQEINIAYSALKKQFKA